jgi:hypothetical protein
LLSLVVSTQAFEQTVFDGLLHVAVHMWLALHVPTPLVGCGHSLLMQQAVVEMHCVPHFV